jgi:hypothetical protein
MITQEYLKSCLVYDEVTGDFYWKHREDKPNNWNARFAGTIAGVANDRYMVITINYRRYLAHHLAWLYAYGKLPNGIDHKDRNRFNNSIDNLRLATQSQNSMNREPGLGWEKHGRKYRARIKLDGQHIELGSFDTVEDAQKAHLEGRQKYFGEFA